MWPARGNGDQAAGPAERAGGHAGGGAVVRVVPVGRPEGAGLVGGPGGAGSR